MKILLSEVRESRGVTQEGLARMIGQSRTNVQNIERARVKSLTLATLEALCEALNCQPGDLLHYVPDNS